MNNWTKFAISLGVFLGLAWLIRSFAFTIYSVPENGLVAGLHSGSRVIVNKVANTAYKTGDVAVFTDSLSNYIGTIKAVPGDTVTLGSALYIIPYTCCKRCGCPDCKFYLIEQGKSQRLVHRHLFVGKASKIF